MDDCSAMHLCWTISPLHRQKLILASAKAQPIWDLKLHFEGEIYMDGCSTAILLDRSLDRDYTSTVLVLVVYVIPK